MFGKVLMVFLSLTYIVLFYSCKDKELGEEDSEFTIDFKSLEQNKEQVTGLILRKRTFHEEILSQGKVVAPESSVVTFQKVGMIEEVPVEPGQWVDKGDLLARLEDFEIKHRIDRLKLQIKKTELDITSELIRLGYDPEKDYDSIPEKILESARLKFGIDLLYSDLELAQHELELSEIRAPISGVISKLEAKPNNLSSNFKTLATILNTTDLEIHFPVLEPELPLIKVGQVVEFQPLLNSGNSYKAKITSISPTVDDRGTIAVIAVVQGKIDKNILDGMTVNCSLKRSIENQLVVPKTAVVDRQGKLVSWKIMSDSTVEWNYVIVQHENAHEYTIVDGVEAGDTIVMDKAFNLSHLEKVIVERVVEVANDDQ